MYRLCKHFGRSVNSLSNKKGIFSVFYITLHEDNHHSTKNKSTLKIKDKHKKNGDIFIYNKNMDLWHQISFEIPELHSMLLFVAFSSFSPEV